MMHQRDIKRLYHQMDPCRNVKSQKTPARDLSKHHQQPIVSVGIRQQQLGIMATASPQILGNGVVNGNEYHMGPMPPPPMQNPMVPMIDEIDFDAFDVNFQQFGGQTMGVRNLLYDTNIASADQAFPPEAMQISKKEKKVGNYSNGASAKPPTKRRKKAGGQEATQKKTTKGGSRKGKTKGSSEKQKRLMLNRERNRLHARQSRLRKKIYVESMEQTIRQLRSENDSLRSEWQGLSPDSFAAYVRKVADKRMSVIDINLTDADSSSGSNSGLSQGLCEHDHTMLQMLRSSLQSFVICDPKLPDLPIIYASENFFKLTQYSRSEVVGRNCRLLQGPQTSPAAVTKIREAIRDEVDTDVVLLNYRKDGTSFWNRLFISPLKNSMGVTMNFLAVQTQVNDEVAKTLLMESGKVER